MEYKKASTRPEAGSPVATEFNEDVDAGAKIGIKMKCNSVDVIAINFQP